VDAVSKYRRRYLKCKAALMCPRCYKAIDIGAVVVCGYCKQKMRERYARHKRSTNEACIPVGE